MSNVVAAGVAALNAVLACVVSFGVDLSQNQVGAIEGAVNGAVLFTIALAAAWKHTPAPAPPVK